MKKGLVVLIIVTSGLALFSTEIMKLSEVKNGMEGIGKTIFAGTQIETFKFKILGIVEKFAPDKNLIIAELISPILDEGGLIAGMSGSPAYINDKLIGSFSYGFQFSKKPIAGITPIEDILKTAEYNNPTYSVDISNIQLDFKRENLKHILESIQNELSRLQNYTPAGLFSPLKLAALTRGFHPQASSYLTPLFVPMQNVKLKDPFEKRGRPKVRYNISPADAVSIPLVEGDFEYSASGTVTHVDGKKVYCFGHPYFNLGSVSFPLHRAEIITVVPSYDNSFKLAATREIIGTIFQDRFSAVQGELGQIPYMIPLKIFLKNRNRSFNLEMVNHPLLTPIITYISLMNIFLSEYQQYGYQSIAVNGKVFIEGEENIIIDDLYSGATAFDDFSNLMMAISYFLINNKEKTVKIQKIDFEIDGSEILKRADIENVLIEKNTFDEGEVINLSLNLRNERGNSFEEKATIRTPHLKPGSLFYLMVADANEIMDFDSKMIKSAYFPTKISALIRAINNLRKNNRIYFKIFIPAEGLFVRGFEYAHLPSTLSNVLSFNSTTRDQSDMLYSTIMEYQYEIPATVSGKKVFKLKIKEGQNVP